MKTNAPRRRRPLFGTLVALALVIGGSCGGAQSECACADEEALRARILPGHRAQVRVDGIGGEFAGTVRKAAADPSFTPYFALTEHDRGRLSFVAEVNVDTQGRELPAGVPVEVRFAADAGQD